LCRKGQIQPIPDPFIEAIVSGKQGPLPSGVQQLQGKSFQIQSASRDFEAVIPGVDAQRVELINREFAAALILSTETLDCRVTFRDIAHRNEPKAARKATEASALSFMARLSFRTAHLVRSPGMQGLALQIVSVSAVSVPWRKAKAL